MKAVGLVLLTALVACGKPPSAPVDAASAPQPPAVGVEADPVVGKVDAFELHLSHVRDRLARLPPTLNPEDAAFQAMVLAAQDLLAVREMYVLKETPKPGERPWQSAERFAANVWRGEPTCEADPGEVKLLYMQQLARYKHPAKFAIWDAQLQCCPDPDKCPPADLAACRAATLPQMKKLAEGLKAHWQTLPPLGLAADVTDVAVAQSPVKGARTDAFEAAVADGAARDVRLQLRRYDFFRAGEPGFGGGHFRPGEPNIAQWVETAHLGDVSQPIETVWGYSVVLLAAREPTRSGKADPVILAQLNAAACQQMAERQRQEWRDGLLHAAVLRWDRDAVESHFGAGVYKRLPRNSARFGQPVPQQ